MGPKKKAAEEGEDVSCEHFFKLYQKLCRATEPPLPICKIVKEKYDKEYVEDGNNLKRFNIYESLGYQGIRALMDAMRLLPQYYKDENQSYQHTISIRLWKTDGEDEGCRAVCQYIATCPAVLMLELLDNQITPLGCEHLGKILHPSAKSQMTHLKLDHNRFGSAGLKYLADGLAQNKNIEHLSLTYCDIDESGARYLFEILIYTQSALQDLILNGNHLRNEGTIQVLKGVSVAKNLKHFHIADNQFVEEDDVLTAIDQCMRKNQNLGHYDFKYNFISDYGVGRICNTLEDANHVFNVEIPERISKETLEEFREKIAANKPKKGKGGKGGKKKKKK